MSDLISRSDVIKVLEECHLDEKLFEKDVFDKVKAIPTAYDASKVVAELEKLKQHNKELSEGAYLEDDKSFYFCAYTNFARAIGIVRKGGVE